VAWAERGGTTPAVADRGPDRTSIAAVIAEYDEPANSLERTVRGILGQTRLPDHVILVDDASPTAPRLAEDLLERVDVIVLANNGGPSVARNRGASATGGDYLLFVDCDVILEPNWVQDAVAFMSAHEKAGAVSGRIVPVSGPRLLRRWYLHFIVPKVHRSRMTAPIRVTQTGSTPAGKPAASWILGVWFVRRAAFEAIGGFDPRLRLRGEDWDFSRRLLDAGYDLYYLPELFAEGREHLSIGVLARKSLRNAGWDLRRIEGESSPEVRPFRLPAAFASVLGSLAQRSGRNLVRRRFSLLPVDFAIALYGLVLVSRAWLESRLG